MAALCGVCDATCINDGSEVKCSGSCNRLFHARCADHDVEFKKTQANKEWKCKACIVHKSAHGNIKTSSTTVTKAFLLRKIEELKRRSLGTQELSERNGLHHQCSFYQKLRNCYQAEERFEK